MYLPDDMRRLPKKVVRDEVEQVGLDDKLRVSGSQISSQVSDSGSENMDCSCASQKTPKHKRNNGFYYRYTGLCLGSNVQNSQAGYTYNYPGCHIQNYGKMADRHMLPPGDVRMNGSSLMLAVSRAKLHDRKV